MTDKFSRFKAFVKKRRKMTAGLGIVSALIIEFEGVEQKQKEE